MENDLARYKYIFDEILTMTDDGFIVVDKGGIVTDINDQYCDFLGTTKEKAIGRNIKETISNSKMIDIVQNAYREEGVIHKFVDGETKESDNSFLLVSRSCVFDENKNVIAGVAQVKFRLQTLDSAQKLMKEYSELEFYKEEYKKINSNQYSFEGVIGSSSNFLEIKKSAMKASKNSFPVLLTGETGTGKEVFARAIHNNSDRKDKPMVSINCGAIPSELLESELFGYEEGTFTGARKGGKKGKFLQADGGTILLDEIGDMPLSMQVKLLRVLQEKEVEKIGGSKPIPIDVRVIAATRRDLVEMIKNGEFREDLYYRLNVINIEMIPLRDRREDILTFANYFLNKINIEYRTAVTLSNEAKQCFENYFWPGNVRELDNVIKSAYASCDEFVIQLTDLPSKMVSNHKVISLAGSDEKMLKHMVDSYESSLIQEILKKCNWNCQKAAEELGIHRSLLYKKIDKYNIKTRR
ncbi:limonene hydroxylase [Clostridium homopropionicum DSM 5847]|uniref:Limonene hydroxylase n=1 Tax=Clostridium homopropionicum DSM 5847 TaxID=1121318 RepID=A0A0L6Z642_9CLOT|nr:sigma-54-dependent Fis family transcriptional regulator [Clostridium homopropionicum]KOA18435.1 limonene hydroxylase [Clostridium homopropionicum DSM 5847]SFF66892.1 PAS domain S-box-containing protein [Clostridium homopropionicum]